MRELWEGWGLALVMSVVMTVGLFHAGLNLGETLATSVRSVIHLLGTPI
jgi:hypothetical protein